MICTSIGCYTYQEVEEQKHIQPDVESKPYIGSTGIYIFRRSILVGTEMVPACTAAMCLPAQSTVPAMYAIAFVASETNEL